MFTTPLNSLNVLKHIIPAYKLVPNCSIQQKPLLIYRQAFTTDVTATKIEQHLRSVGVVEPQWRYTMYSTDHFHSTTHEVLAVAQGCAKLCFGHADNPDSLTETVRKGDVMIVPAGVSHRLIDDVSGDFQMVGSYPVGKSWDMCYGNTDEHDKIKAIEDLGWFDTDPIYGPEGPAASL